MIDETMIHDGENREAPEPPARPSTEAGDAIYRIPEQNLDALKFRVEKLNKRAARLKMDPLVLTEIGEEFVTKTKYAEPEDRYDDDYGDGITRALAYRPKTKIEYKVRFVLVTVTGKCPRVNGWAMAATIAHDEAGNILRTVPGFETTLPAVYRTAKTICDHCETNRQRKDTYVLQSEDGAWKQVGRNCLADFLRTENAAGMAEMAELLSSLDAEMGVFEDDDWAGGGNRTHYWDTVTLLAQVACCVRASGWCSRGEARTSYIPKQATVDQALDCFNPKLWNKLSASDQEKLTPTEDDKARAVAAIEWAKGLAVDVGNDYLWNIRVVSHRENIGPREAGLAGSIISAYARHLEQEMAKKYEKDHPSQHFGTVKERRVWTFVLMGLKELESEWGHSTLVTFRDLDGNRAKWFSSNCPFAETQIGETFEVLATIKGHDEYKGSKQTLLTRAEIHDPAAIEKARLYALEVKLLKKQIKGAIQEVAA